MKERPILFSGAMVRAILAGRKTQTRRVIKVQPPAECTIADLHDWDADFNAGGIPYLRFSPPFNGAWQWWPIEGKTTSPYGTRGDRLWVRETLRWEDEGRLVYDVDSEPILDATIPASAKPVTRRRLPSIFMPRWASRITLEVVSVRVERVKDISEADAIAEGIDRSMCGDGAKSHLMRTGFCALWETINGPRGFGWDLNPWVWVVEFKRV